MSSSEQDTKQKQTFLRTMIIERGYEPIKFTEYLSKQREEGHDINNWTMADLTAAVLKYIEITPKPEIPECAELTENDVDISENEDQIKAKHSIQHTDKDSSPVKGDRTMEEKKPPTVKGIWIVTTDSNTVKDDQPKKATGGSSLNDQRQQITKMIISQSEEEKAAMNDFTLTVVPTRKPKLTELNGERRLKIKISE